MPIIIILVLMWLTFAMYSFVYAHIFGLILLVIATLVIVFTFKLIMFYICATIEVGLKIWHFFRRTTDSNKRSRYTWKFLHPDGKSLAERREEEKKTKEAVREYMKMRKNT